MKSVFFSVKTLDGSLVQGYIINQNKNSAISFDTKDIPSGALITNNIENIGSFVAAYVKKKALSKNYSSVILDGVETEILWEKIKTDSDLYSVMYAHPNIQGQLFTFEGGLISVMDINNKPVSVQATSLGFKEVKVPKQQKYTTDPILNEIFSLNNFPFDYNKDLNNIILQNIKRYKRRKLTDDIYFNEYGLFSFIKSKYHPFVIPAKYFK